MSEGETADLPLLVYEGTGGSHEDDAFVWVPTQEVVHNHSGDDGFTQTCGQANERVVLNSSEDDVALIFAELWRQWRDKDFHRRIHEWLVNHYFGFPWRHRVIMYWFQPR